jgi:nitrate/TMAO reductase-like tetraheme cytochrome c subunit
MWQKIKEFSAKDPLLFTVILAILITGGGFAAVQSMHMTSTAEFCKTCHPKEEIGVRGEYHTWRKGVHSEADVSCLDCHGAPGIKGYMNAHVVAGMRSMYHELFTSEEDVVKHLTEFASTVEGAMHAASEEACVFCHTDSGNADMRRSRVIKIAGEFRGMDEVINPAYRQEYGRNDILTEGVSAGVEPNHKAHMDAGLSCFSCHLGVGHSGERFHKPKMETCFTCHDEIRETVKVPANEDCATCHVNQKNIQEGNYVKGLEGDRWYMADLNCSDCHESAFVRPNSDKCVACHDDSYAVMMEDTQKAFNAKIGTVQKLRDKMMEQRDGQSHGKLALMNELIYIVRVLENDGSAGVHNPEYFDMMFDRVAELAVAVAEYVEPVEEVSHEPVVQEEKAEEAHAEAPAGPVNSEEMLSIIEGMEELNMAERHVPAPTKPAVIFAHKAHAEKLACESCHADPSAGQLKFEVGEVKGMKNVFHEELCLKCHKEMKVKTSCNDCHKK